MLPSLSFSAFLLNVCACVQVVEREEQVARLQAEMAALRGDVEARCAQLESGDEALSALSRRLRDAQRELELSHAHTQECELVIDALRDNVATMRCQVRIITGEHKFSGSGVHTARSLENARAY